MGKAGRPKGARNKATEFIKPIAQRYGPDCIYAMMRIVKNPRSKDCDRKGAAELIMAYGYGKPVQRNEFGGPDGGAIPVTVDGVDQALQKVIAEMVVPKPE